MSLLILPFENVFNAKDLITSSEAAHILNVTQQTVQSLIKRKTLRSFRICRIHFLDRKEVIEHRKHLRARKQRGDRRVKARPEP